MAAVELAKMTVEIVTFRRKEYVSLDDLRLWLMRSALENTDPVQVQVLTGIADELGKK